MDMLTLFTIPSSTTVISEAQTVVTNWFPEFLPVIYLALGITVVVMSIRYIRRLLKAVPKGVMGGGRRGRRMRR